MLFMAKDGTRPLQAEAEVRFNMRLNLMKLFVKSVHRELLQLYIRSLWTFLQSFPSYHCPHVHVVLPAKVIPSALRRCRAGLAAAAALLERSSRRRRATRVFASKMRGVQVQQLVLPSSWRCHCHFH